MSEENINLDLTLGTPNYSQPPSLQEPAQESRNSSQLASPAPQESLHRPHREFEFIPPAGQESIDGVGQSVEESVNYRRHRQSQFDSPSIQEYHHRRQLRQEESVRGYNFPSQLQHLSPEAVQFFKHSLFQRRPQIVKSVIQSPSLPLDVSSLLPPPPQETQPEQEITTLLHPWEQSPAKLHTLDYIHSKNINMVSGEIMCKTCKTRVSLEYNIEEKFKKVRDYMLENLKQLGGKASTVMLKADHFGRCCKCGTVGMRPVISEKNEEINWLFLILGQMLGCCNVKQLKYFCKKNKLTKRYNKDRLVYIAYVAICKQLDPTLPFEL